MNDRTRDILISVSKELSRIKRSIFDYAPKSKPAEDYRAFYKALHL